MVAPIDLPSWPSGTVAILVTAGDPPHAIPVSAVLRAGPDRILLGLARRRESLTRLRRDPRVTVAVCAPDVALSADGRSIGATMAALWQARGVSCRWCQEVHGHGRECG
jgi:hypothetical protein